MAHQVEVTESYPRAGLVQLLDEILFRVLRVRRPRQRFWAGVAHGSPRGFWRLVPDHVASLTVQSSIANRARGNQNAGASVGKGTVVARHVPEPVYKPAEKAGLH